MMQVGLCACRTGVNVCMRVPSPWCPVPALWLCVWGTGWRCTLLPISLDGGQLSVPSRGCVYSGDKTMGLRGWETHLFGARLLDPA